MGQVNQVLNWDVQHIIKCDSQTYGEHYCTIVWLPWHGAFLCGLAIWLMWRVFMSQWWNNQVLLGVILVEGEGIMGVISLVRVHLWDWACSWCKLCGRRFNWTSPGKFMQSLENLIDWSVATPPIPPTFDVTPVIPMYHEVLLLLLFVSEESNQASQHDSFSPADISLTTKCFPAWDEAPFFFFFSF